MTYNTYGDMGDVLYMCPCMKMTAGIHGKPVTLYCRDGLRPSDPFTARIPLIAPLLLAQDYIEAVLPWDGQEVDHDTCMFRDDGLPFGCTLAERQATWLGMSPDLREPWLKVIPDKWAPIVVNRTARYRNSFFPWAGLVKVFGSQMAFIGHPHEHKEFCQDFGHIAYLPTTDMLKAAEVIAGSELFIGNQSSCNAIAEGLKHRTIQETDLMSPDCIYPRPNAVHCHDGALDLKFHGKRFTSKSKFLIRAHLNETPPNGWCVSIDGHSASSYAFDLTVQQISLKLQQHGIRVPTDLREIIIEQNSTGFQDHPVTRLIAMRS